MYFSERYPVLTGRFHWILNIPLAKSLQSEISLQFRLFQTLIFIMDLKSNNNNNTNLDHSDQYRSFLWTKHRNWGRQKMLSYILDPSSFHLYFSALLLKLRHWGYMTNYAKICYMATKATPAACSFQLFLSNFIKMKKKTLKHPGAPLALPSKIEF